MKTKKRQESTSQTHSSQFQQTVTNNQHRVSSIEHPASSPRPFIIPIFIPHAGCPHQCVFCNQVSTTGANQKRATPAELRFQIREFLRFKKANRKPVQIAFFGGNFLGLKSGEIRSLLKLASEFTRDGQVDSIRFSTRPDTINERSLDMIKDYPVSTVELGVQSMDDQVLALAGRGHSKTDTVHAVERLKERQFSIGLQMMVGLPGDDETSALITAQMMALLSPDFVRIYPTVVVANSRLAEWYKRGVYVPLTLAEGVTLVKKIYLKFKQAGIDVIRMGLQVSDDHEDRTTVLAGPYHPAFGHLVHSEIFLDMALLAIESANDVKETLSIFVNPRSISKMRGLNNSNIKRLKEKFHFQSIAIVPDSYLAAEELRVG